MKTYKNFVAAVATAVIISFGGCSDHVGLGEAVDTEAPTLEITYPPSSAVVKEAFAFGGLCHDDKSISRIEVKVRNVETQNEDDAVQIPATNVHIINGEKWYVTLNEKTSDELNEWGLPEYEFCDGKYEISAIVYDEAGHHSVSVSRMVEIDNTPPIFFITSPQIDDTTDMTNYGTRLKIVGTIADAHKVSQMAIKIYDESGAVVADSETNPIVVNDVVTAGGTSETIASYLAYDNTDSALNVNYVQIYFQGDETRTGTQTYSCEIMLTDEAKIYREPFASAARAADDTAETTADEDAFTDGNSTSCLYAYYNVRDSVGSDVFNATDMMHVINGTYSGENYDILKAALQKENSTQAKAYFTLNPKANPTYSVTGFGFDKASGTDTTAWFEATASSKISLVVMQGLNQDPIDKNSLRAYIAGPIPAGDDVESFVAAHKTLLATLYDDMETLSDTYAYDSNDDDAETKAAHAAYNETVFSDYLTQKADWLAENGITYYEQLTMTGAATGSGESYTYPYALPDGSKLTHSGEVYLLLATGRDKEGLSFISGDSYYGFKFVVTGNKPTFKGVSFVKNDASAQVIAANGYSNLADMSISGTATSDSGVVQNVSFTLTVTDEASSSDDAAVILTLTGAEEYEASARKANQEFTLDLLQKATAEQKALLARSGNRYLYSVDLKVNADPGGDFSAQYILHIDTKVPMIEFTAADTVYTENGKNWVGRSGLSRLRGTIDEENPKSVSYVIQKNGESIASKAFENAMYSFNLTADADDAFDGITLATNDCLQVIVQATDKAGNQSDPAVTGTSEEYYADATAPVLDKSDEKQIKIGGKIYNGEDKTWLKDTAMQFEGYYIDKESGVSVVYYVINDAPSGDTSVLINKAIGSMETTGVAGAMGVDKSGKFSSTISGFNASGENKIYLLAVDNVGNPATSIAEYTLYIDSKGPEFEDIPEAQRNIAANGTEDKTLQFVVRDQENASGVAIDNMVVNAIFNGTPYILEPADVTYDAETGNASFVIDKDYIKAAKHVTREGSVEKNVTFDGNVTIQIIVPDKAGNESTNQQCILQVDSSAPIVKVTVPATVTASTVADINWITGKTTIQGTMIDVGVAGVDSSKCKYLIPTIAQQVAVAQATTAAERIAALRDATWNDFVGGVNVAWTIPYESSYLESSQGKNGKDSFVYYGAATENGVLAYATAFGSTAAEKARYRTVPVYFFVSDLAGNEDIDTTNIFYVDIEGGKPKTSISYPKDKTDGQWQKLSEEVALQGTAQDNEAITKVALTELWYATADASDVFAGGEDFSGWKRVKATDTIPLLAVDGVELIKEADADGNLVITQKVTGTAVVEAFDIECNVQYLAGDNEKITAIKAVVSSYDENDYGYSATRMAYIDTEAPVLRDEKIVKLADALSVTQITSVANGVLTDINGNTHTVLVERKYEADMWLSGLAEDGSKTAHWYYIGTVTDDSVVEGVKLTSLSHTTATQEFKTEATADYDGITPQTTTTEYTFAIPVPTTEDGNMYAKLTRNDGAHKDVNSYVSLNIDNTPPMMYKKSTGTVATVASPVQANDLQLIADGVLGEKYVVENSNGSFSFGDKVHESGSGLAFIGFWFERAAKRLVYNPVVKTATVETYKAGIPEAEQSTAAYQAEKTAGAVYVNAEQFPALYIAASDITLGTTKIDSATYTTITYAGLSANDFINRSCGMVKINGSYYKVQAVHDNTVVLASDTGLTAAVDVEFIYAHFVDHIGTEIYTLSSDGTTYTVSNDDDNEEQLGDGVAESLKVKSGVYTWTAEFDSQNMADGPARIHVVSVDNAGNVSHAYVDTSIQNNRPRIAKVFLATDLNGSDTFYFDESAYTEEFGDFATAFGKSKDDVTNPKAYYEPSVIDGTELGEFVFYSTLDKNGDVTALAELRDRGVNNNFIAKDAMLILPEIVGGNTSSGELKYTYAISEAAAEPVAAETQILASTERPLQEFVTGSARKISLQKTGSITNSTSLPANGIYFSKESLNAYESWTTAGKKSRYFSFTIWDTTGNGDLTQGIDTLWAMLSIPIVVNVTDEEPPEATFDTLYWNSKEDSSTVYDAENQPLGHVDTEADLGTTKPEVAGQVYLRGKVADGTRIQEIQIIEPQSTTPITVAKYENGLWASAAYDESTEKYYSTYFDTDVNEMVYGYYDTSAKEIVSAQREDTAIATAKWPSNWKRFEILSEREPSQKDHLVTFRFAVDTTKFGVKTDQNFLVVAVDKDSNKSSADATATTQTTAAVPTYLYTMNFVPYIKGILDAEGNAMPRSRLGRYPIRAGSEIIIEGMNFSVHSTYSVQFYTTNAEASDATGNDVQGTLKETIANANVTKIKDGQIQVTAPLYSRYVEVTVDGVTTKNNANNNTKGNNIEEGYLASEKTTLGAKKASQNGTDFWTDDRYVAAWNVDTEFPGSINPHSGVIKKITAQNSGSGWGSDSATGTGGLKNITASNPGGGYLYKQPGYSTEVDPITGMNGSYYAALSSDDLKIYGYASGQDYTSTGKGDNVAYNSSEVAYVSPVDEMDCTIVNGMPYYVLQDNSLGGDSGSVWGLGLHMVREGIWYDRGYFNPFKGNTIEEAKLPYYVERQGYNVASWKRDPSTGYDSVLYQFKNPRIAGWFNKDDSLLYRSDNGGAYTNGVDYIYISYYDSFARCLKYAAYRVGHRLLSNDGKYANVALKEWGKIDVDHDLDIVAEMTSSPNTAGNQPEQKTYNHMTDGASIIAGTERLSNTANFTEEAGEWSDVAVDATTGDPRPVIVYYNKTKKCLEVARGANAFPQSPSEWKKSTPIRPDGVKTDFGRYVSMAMDANGNLHIAAQEVSSSKLYYLYLTKSGDTYTVAKSVAVDATTGAGKWTDIELTDPTKTTIKDCAPVISYINTSFLGTTQGIKVAYLESVTDGTPSFEAMTDPAKWQATDQRTSVLPDVKETKDATKTAVVGVGFNSDMLALDFLRGEN